MLYKVGTKLRFNKVDFIQYSTKRVNRRYVATKVN
ncbi:hypothetical protein [Caudoviricetes sp.]|nr:hypothetical protein [Caudoviricetes sp.]